jgi:hypothetical protein
MIGYAVGLVGMWILSDGILSWSLYLNAPSYEGSKRQTFKRDHWVRLVRIICGALLIAWGFALLRIRGVL